jgi:hypothetical protein
MLSRAGLVRMLAAARRPLWGALLGLAVGCSHPESLAPEGLAQRILPPPDAPAQAAARAPDAAGDGNKSGEAEKTVGQGSDAPPQP